MSTRGASDNDAARLRVVVFGCGGIGGTVAARLGRTRELFVVTNNTEITTAVAQRGLLLNDVDGEVLAQPHVVTRPDALPSAAFDIALLAVPPNRLAQAARDALRTLTPTGVVVPLANGLPEERLADVVDAARIVGCIVGFGASQRRPGDVERTSEGGLTVGTLAGALSPMALRVAEVLADVAPTTTTENLRGARWSKLAINCAISSLGTLGGERLGALMRHRFVRRLFLEVISEAANTAVALHVPLEKVAGTIDLEWLSLTSEEMVAPGSASLVAKHAVMLAVGARFRRLRSSMLAALERGREPPVDFLNGEVVSAGARVGIPTPINAAVVDEVKRLWRKETTPNLARLQELHARTRSP